jgi:pimeloyl-ACP methyl ester carboxylesterase
LWASAGRAEELPIQALAASARLAVQKAQRHELSAAQAKTAALGLLKAYKSKVNSYAFWNLVPGSDKIVLAFPGATLSPAYIEGPVPEMFQKKGYSFVSLAAACEYETDRDETCDRQNWEYDADFAVALGQLLGKKVSLYGFSMGGAIAVRAAQKFPEAIDELFLVAPALEIGFKVLVGEEEIPISRFSCVDGRWPYPEIVEKVRKERGFSDHLLREACEMYRLAHERKGDSPYGGIRAKGHVILTESDELVANEEILRFLDALGARASVYSYPRAQKVGHASLTFLAGLRVDFGSLFSNNDHAAPLKPYTWKELDAEYKEVGLKTVPRAFWDLLDRNRTKLAPLIVPAFQGLDESDIGQ